MWRRSWGRSGEGYWPKPTIARDGDATLIAEHASIGRYRLRAEGAPELLLTDNDTNLERLYGVANPSPYVKDAFDAYVVHGNHKAVNPAGVGTKAAALYRLDIAAGE